MDILQVPESAEYSVISLENLNPDCLLLIFQHLPLFDSLRLRYQSRSMNQAVLQYLRASRKLALFLNADRTVDDLERIWADLRDGTTGSCTIEDAKRVAVFDPKKDPTLLRHQTHFRLEEFIPVNAFMKSDVGSLEDKVASLIYFLTNHTPNLTKLALLINHAHYFWSIAKFLTPLRKLRVLFIDLTYFLPRKFLNYPSTEVVDAVSGLPQLESLYYFSSSTCTDVLYHRRVSGDNGKPEVLSSGENFVEAMLKRLRVLHVNSLEFPVGLTFDRIEELGVYSYGYNYRKNTYPGLKTLIANGFFNPAMELPVRLSDWTKNCPFGNLRILKIPNSFFVTTETMELLNILTNLVELHCCSMKLMNYTYRFQAQPEVPRNQTIVRLFTQFVDENYVWTRSTNGGKIISISQRDRENYVELCRKYFKALRRLTNERPEVVIQF